MYHRTPPGPKMQTFYTYTNPEDPSDTWDGFCMGAREEEDGTILIKVYDDAGERRWVPYAHCKIKGT